MEALLQYALHVARNSFQEQEKSLSPQSKFEKDVKVKLTEKLDKRTDPSLAVHSIFGKYLPNLSYLDRSWLNSNLERIFPRQPEMADYWEAAWNGYLFRGDFFGDLYDEALKPYYKYALEQLAQGQQGRAGSEASRGRLAQHLGLAYWRGIETLGEDNSIIEMFFNLAPDDVRANFINYLEGILQSAELSAK